MGGGRTRTKEDSQGEEDEEKEDDDDSAFHQAIIDEPGSSSQPFDLTGDNDAPKSPPVHRLTRG
eukprot:1609110-Ditylum_brightwellii.AAC.1